MLEGNISQQFRLKNIGKTRKYFVEEIGQNELISKKHKKVSTTLNYIEHLYNYTLIYSKLIQLLDVFQLMVLLL